jgi:PAS domain S-box-containing protein
MLELFRSKRSPALRYGVAVLLALVAGGVSFLLSPVIEPHAPSLLFVLAVAIAAWFGGRLAALVTTVISGVLCLYVFTEPLYSFAIETTTAVRDLVLFVGIGVVVSVLGGQSRELFMATIRCEEESRKLYESMDEGFASVQMVYDDAGRPIDCRYLKVNPAFSKETGLNEVVGRTLRDILPGVEQYWIESLERVVRTGQSERITSPPSSLGKNFEAFAFRTGPGRCAVTFRDVTERKRAELNADRLAAIVSSTNEAVIGVDLSGVVNTWNEAAERLYGYSDKEAIGQHISLLASPNQPDETDALLNRIGQGERLVEFETVRKSKGGSEIPISLTISPILDRTGHIEGASRISHDISERKQSEAKLKTALDEKVALLQEVHHRVKNNLQIICSLLSLQGHSIKDQEAADRLKECEGRVRSMAMIHHQLYEHGDMSSIDLAVYGRNLAAQLFATYSRSASITRRIEAISTCVPIDQAVTCGLILNELITNALKHAYPSGDGVVVISISSDGDAVCLQVSDQGVGLPAGFNCHTTDSLGMKIVCSLTGQLNGQLEVGTAPGSSFTVRFTIRSPAHSSTAPDQRSSLPAALPTAA